MISRKTQSFKPIGRIVGFTSRIFSVNPQYSLFCPTWQNFFARRQKKFSNSEKETKKQNLSEIFFFKLFPWMAVVTTLMKIVQLKVPFFWLKVGRTLKPCAQFQILFFLKIFQGYERCSFDHPCKFFQQNLKKKLVEEFFFQNRGFSPLRKVSPPFLSLAIFCIIGNSEENLPPVYENLINNLKNFKKLRNTFCNVVLDVLL